MPINNDDFEYVRLLVQQRSAIVLDVEKQSLVESRLTMLIRKEGIESVKDLFLRLRSTPPGRLHDHLVEAMTTNETLFFRDAHPFDMLKNHIFPQLIEKRAKERISLWCAGCSSGQEPYSLAMLIRENFSQHAGLFKIMATDLSKDMISRSKDGVYTQFEVNRGLPAAYLVKYFSQEKANWRIKEDIRAMVDFQEVNLAETWPRVPPVDMLFFRNVMIYFDVETKKEMLRKARQVLRPDGYLLLGAAETTLNIDNAFERVQSDRSWCYQLKKT